MLLVGLAGVLAAVTGAAIALGVDTGGPAPQAAFDASLDAADGWPDGQRLRIRHVAGDALPVAEVSLVVTFPRTGDRARLTGFPVRQLTGEVVRGDDVFDATYAGVDGPLDAAHTDGRWESGETVELRVAQHRLDLRTGDPARVRVVHDPSGVTLATRRVTAT